MNRDSQSPTVSRTAALLAQPVALLVVDMQNDYCVPEGITASLGFDVSGMPAFAKRLSSFVEAARPNVALTIFIRTTVPQWVRSPALDEQFRRTAMKRQVSPHLSDWYGVLPAETDVIVEKHRYSAFVGTDLESILRSNQITTLITVGVATDICVESTVRDAFMRDFNVILVSDCTQATTGQRQKNSEAIIDVFFGRVHTSAEILDALNSKLR